MSSRASPPAAPPPATTARKSFKAILYAAWAIVLWCLLAHLLTPPPSYSFNLQGATPCSGTQPAFVGTPGNYKKLPNIGSEVCAQTTWGVTRVDSGFQVSAKNAGADGISGTYTIPSSDFAVVDGVEKYTGNGIVILYGIAQ